MHNEISLVFISFFSFLFFFLFISYFIAFLTGVGKVKCKLLLEYLDSTFLCLIFNYIFLLFACYNFKSYHKRYIIAVVGRK